MLHRSKCDTVAPAAAAPEVQWLATAMVPAPGARSNALDRHVLAVVGYLQGARGRFVPLDSLERRWPSWLPRPVPKAMRTAVRRLVARNVLEDRDGALRVSRELQHAAADRGCRFRYVPGDFDGTLTPATAELLAMVRGRAQGRTTAWGDSADYLAGLLGADERTVRRGMAELTDAGRLEIVARSRLRSGHKLPVLRVVESACRTSQTRGLRAVRSPGCEERSPGCRERSPDNLVLKQDQASPGSSAPPRAVALLTWAPEPGPASPEQSRACGADDPIGAPVIPTRSPAAGVLPLPHFVRVVPPWAELEGMERAAVASLVSWDAWLANLRRAVARLHLAPRTAANLLAALTAAGVFVPIRPMNEAGRRGLRRRRQELAELLQAQGLDPTALLEGVFMAAAALRGSGGEPASLGAYIAALLAPKPAGWRERSAASVAAGNGPLPWAAGADAMTHLGRPGYRLAGESAYPARWWRDSAPQDVLDRIADLRGTFAMLAEFVERIAQTDGGQVAAVRLRREFGDAERTRRQQLQDRELDGAARRAKGRIVGAVHARDWRRLGSWIEDAGITLEQAAEWAGVGRDTIAAGLANTTRRATA